MPDVPRSGQSERSGRPADARRLAANAFIQFPDAVDTTRSTAIPNSVLDDDRLSPETRLVYIMLRRLAAARRGCPIDQRELARSIGIPLQRIARHLTLLERSGRIQVQADGRPDAQTTTRYWLAAPAVPEGDPPPRTASMAPQSQTRRPARGNAGLSLLDRLIVMGVDAQVAGCLVTTYPKERVAGALRAAHRHRPRPRDPAAWVVAAIRQGRSAQSAVVAAHQRQAAQEAATAAWERRTDAALAALPTQTQQSLRRQATEIVEQRFNRRIAASTIGTMLVTVELRRLVAEQVGIPVSS